MRFRKILCPIDFSPGSDQALRTAVQLAKGSDAELVLTHAWHVPALAYSGEAWTLSADIVEHLVQDSTRGLAAALSTALGLGARASSVLQNGLPSDRIVALLHDDPAFDLVVVGTHGRTALARVVFGSVAEQVVRHAPCSVLVARPRLADAPFKTILCPIDFSDSSRHAIDVATELGSDGGEISLMHVIELPTSYAQDLATIGAVTELDRVTTTVIDQWAEKLRARANGPVTAQTRRGRAGAQILDVLDSAAFDLVVMGSHGRTGLRRALLGSVAEKIVRHAACPVLVARKRS
jgi:nucleotide-binding universal stress UspA family protein